MSRYRILTRSERPTAERVPYRDRWAGDELDQLRSLMWWRLRSRIARDAFVTNATLAGVEDMRRKFERDGKRLARNPLSRSWGRWLLTVSRELRRWTGVVRGAR